MLAMHLAVLRGQGYEVDSTWRRGRAQEEEGEERGRGAVPLPFLTGEQRPTQPSLQRSAAVNPSLNPTPPCSLQSPLLVCADRRLHIVKPLKAPCEQAKRTLAFCAGAKTAHQKWLKMKHSRSASTFASSAATSSACTALCSPPNPVAAARAGSSLAAAVLAASSAANF